MDYLLLPQVKRLVRGDPYCVNIPEHNGFTSLHLSLILRRSKITRFLLKVDTLDFYATDLFGRLPEELADTPQLQDQIRRTRTQPSTRWAAMCDEQIPLSTADGLSDWTNQFKSVHAPWSDSTTTTATGEQRQLSSSTQIGLFAGKTSASQDGVYEYIDRVRGLGDGDGSSGFTRDGLKVDLLSFRGVKMGHYSQP